MFKSPCLLCLRRMKTVSPCSITLPVSIGLFHTSPSALSATSYTCSVAPLNFASFPWTLSRNFSSVFTRFTSSTFSVLSESCSFQSQILLNFSHLSSSAVSAQSQSLWFLPFLCSTTPPSKIFYCSDWNSHFMTSVISLTSTPWFVHHSPIYTSDSNELILCTCWLIKYLMSLRFSWFLHKINNVPNIQKK